MKTQQPLGHINIRNTQKHIQLVEWGKNEYETVTAETKEERIKLLNAGFTYIEMDKDGISYYRRLK